MSEPETRTAYEIKEPGDGAWREVTRHEYIDILDSFGLLDPNRLRKFESTSGTVGRIRHIVPPYDLAEMQADAAKVGWEFHEMGEGTPYGEVLKQAPREL